MWGQNDSLQGPEQDQIVYVIDDDVEIRRSLHFLLSTVGYVSWPFSCASDFLENIENLQPAPILLDIRMPQLDGIEFMTELHSQGIKWPVIVMTAFGNIPIAVAAIKLGAVDLLEKPLDFELLETNLNTALERLFSVRNAAEKRRSARHLYDACVPKNTKVDESQQLADCGHVTAQCRAGDLIMRLHRQRYIDSINVCLIYFLLLGCLLAVVFSTDNPITRPLDAMIWLLL